MKSDLYKRFVNEIAFAIFDIELLIEDHKFEHLIGLDNSLSIRNMIYNDINLRYTDRINEKINETVEYKFENEFFKILQIKFNFIDNCLPEIIMDKDVCLVDFDNTTKILSIHIDCSNPAIMDFSIFKFAFLIGYYQYLTENDVNNEFVDFMNYLILNNSHRPSNSINVFESAIDDVYEIRKNIRFGVL